jgi:hypothetical protein
MASPVEKREKMRKRLINRLKKYFVRLSRAAAAGLRLRIVSQACYPHQAVPRVDDLYVQVDVLSPTSRAGEALTSEPLPIRGFIVNPIQPRRSASAPARLSAPNPQSPEEHLPRDSPPAPMCCVAAQEPDGRCTLSVQADITGSTLRLILRLDSLHSGAQRVGARAYAFS